uniref:Uncharacterized protein n=1 Tax=Vespula pensylvanica TaxID=30213 RepID=A0A834K2T8_VESPE|nr:hypothetical protein H0235_016179 [Vespula pensylvanica]
MLQLLRPSYVDRTTARRFAQTLRFWLLLLQRKKRDKGGGRGGGGGGGGSSSGSGTMVDRGGENSRTPLSSCPASSIPENEDTPLTEILSRKAILEYGYESSARKRRWYVEGGSSNTDGGGAAAGGGDSDGVGGSGGGSVRGIVMATSRG